MILYYTIIKRWVITNKLVAFKFSVVPKSSYFIRKSFVYTQKWQFENIFGRYNIIKDNNIKNSDFTFSFYYNILSEEIIKNNFFYNLKENIIKRPSKGANSYFSKTIIINYPKINLDDSYIDYLAFFIKKNVNKQYKQLKFWFWKLFYQFYKFEENLSIYKYKIFKYLGKYRKLATKEIAFNYILDGIVYLTLNDLFVLNQWIWLLYKNKLLKYCKIDFNYLNDYKILYKNILDNLKKNIKDEKFLDKYFFITLLW